MTQSPESPLQDPVTLYATGVGTRSLQGEDEWALIRYIGAPIGEVIPVRPPGLSFGRSGDNEISLPEPEVSRRHACIEVANGEDGQLGITIRDLGSTNGTYVNGHRIKGTVELRSGDVVRVAAHAFKLKRLDDMERHYHQAVLAQTTVDALTGVGNRATVLGYLEKHVDLAKRYGRSLSVILCDLDHFKRVNDEHDHATGDQVLQMFGVLVLGRIRGSDQVGRIGGEEFLVVLPETAGQEALSIAEDLRKALAAQPVLSAHGTRFSATCSLGVAELREHDAEGGSFLARADAALYRAKALGRNRVEFDNPPRA